jgi:nucleoside-diphosphate-sugar epimerase
VSNILITGGAGFLGSVMVPELLEAGHKVTVLDSFIYDQNSLALVCGDSNFTVVNGDVRKKKIVLPLLKEADIIIPLAALVGAPLCAADPEGAHSVNHGAIKLMLEHMSLGQHLLMPTTNSAYGTGDANNYCDESSPLNPISEYAKDKVEVEKMILERENSISFRLATVFGVSPRMRIDLLVNDFTYRAVKDHFIVIFEGHFKRNYIHIRDVARVFLHGILQFDSMKGEIYNVGLSDSNLSKIDLCEVIQKILPDFFFHEAEVGKDPDQRNYVVSNAKIEATGFKPAYSLSQGIHELIKGYTMIKENRYRNF